MPYWENPEIFSGNLPSNIPGGAVKPELGLCVLHQGYVPTDWSFRLVQMSRFMPPYIYMTDRNQPYDTAREQVTRACMDRGVEWIFHLDSDVLMPLDGIIKMIEWSKKFKLPLMSGLYWAKKPQKMPCAWLKVGEHPEEKKYDFAPLNVEPHIEKGSIVPCDVTGAGALLIHADVFRKLTESDPEKPFFQWGVGRPGLWQMSEDFYFCMRCKNELDIQVHLATAVQCNHKMEVYRDGKTGEFIFPDM